MPISVQPVDGLIHRLLQQNSKPVSSSHTQARNDNANDDHISISSNAQTNQSASANEPHVHIQNKSGGKALESHLLNLYRSNDALGG